MISFLKYSVYGRGKMSFHDSNDSTEGRPDKVTPWWQRKKKRK